MMKTNKLVNKLANKLALEQRCILLRDFIEIWLDKEKAERFGNDLVNGLKGIVKIEGRFLNVVDIVGIFKPEDLINFYKKKSGQWKCEYGIWHEKEDKCNCEVDNIPQYYKQFKYASKSI